MPIPYSQFVRASLYGPVALSLPNGPEGYYRKNRRRIGLDDKTDFYTSSSLSLFPKLLASALTTLRELHRLENATLIEIGNEPRAPVFPKAPHGFYASLNFPLGNPPKIESPAILFSNELFDALPFDRFRYDKGGWRLLGLDPEKKILDLDLGPAPVQAAEFLGTHFPDGATVDLSLETFSLIEQVCGQKFKGLFVAFDYGLTLSQLLANPRPTARAYCRHRQLSLAEALALPPGGYDITHHVIWDLLTLALQKNGFTVQPPISQESFFVNYASGVFPTLTPNERKELTTLLHPAHMGQAFDLLIAHR